MKNVLTQENFTDLSVLVGKIIRAKTERFGCFVARVDSTLEKDEKYVLHLTLLVVNTTAVSPGEKEVLYVPKDQLFSGKGIVYWDTWRDYLEYH